MCATTAGATTPVAEILLTDVPGIGGHEEGLDEVATEEAKRAHLVLFVCDSDLTRAETRRLSRLLLTSTSRSSSCSTRRIDTRPTSRRHSCSSLLERVDDIGGQLQRDHVVAVTAGGEVDVIERNADGSEANARRTRPADIGVLVIAINRLLADEARISGRSS